MRPDLRLAGLTVVGGFLLGFLDFAWIKFVPHPFGGLGNSSAVWAVAAFLFTYWRRPSWLPGILAAGALLVIAVPSYYLAAMLIQQDDPANMWNTNALLWMAFGVIAGAVFGAAGVAARRPGRWRAVAVAVPAAVLFAEAALLAARIGDPSYGTGPLWPALIAVGLGLVLVAVLAAGWRQRGAALLTALPVGVVGFALFRLAGFA